MLTKPPFPIPRPSPTNQQVRLLAQKLTKPPKTRRGSEGCAVGDVQVDAPEMGESVISAEEFVRFIGGGYDAVEAAEGRLRKILSLLQEKEGISLEEAFGALDEVLENPS